MFLCGHWLVPSTAHLVLPPPGSKPRPPAEALPLHLPGLHPNSAAEERGGHGPPSSHQWAMLLIIEQCIMSWVFGSGIANIYMYTDVVCLLCAV